MKKWVLLRKGADFKHISDKYNVSMRLASLIRNREVISDEEIENYLNGNVSDLHDGLLMKDMDKAIDLICEGIDEGKKIRVIGDYDADGVNATYILVTGLRRLDAEVDSDIPDRIEDGYGISMGLIERAYSDDVDIIITCDNGIAAREEMVYAKSLGMTVIITDHHEIPYEMKEGEKQYLLPKADAVINPKQEECDYPDSRICGAAVAYKLVESVSLSLGLEADEFDDLLENVAIATICDVCDLVGENRILVKEGLERLRRTGNIGLNALIHACEIDKEKLNVYHLGFIIGPCVNAGGRLDTAKRALDLLLSEDERSADNLAGELKSLNDIRKEMTEKAVEEAKEQIASEYYEEDKVLVIYLPYCHESIAGIVAGRIRETYYKPTFVLTEGSEGIKGSGRSIDGYNMYEALALERDLLTRFGGHTMAAGLSLTEDNIEVLRERLNRNCKLTEEDLSEKLIIDMEMGFSKVTKELVQELSILEPFGKGNRRPVFAIRSAKIIYGKILGENRNVIRLKLQDSTSVMDGIYFANGDKFSSAIEAHFGKVVSEDFVNGKKVDIDVKVAYYPEVNSFNGNEYLQIRISDMEIR